MHRTITKRPLMLLLVLGGVLWLGINLLTLQTYPTPHCDEAFYARTSLRFVSNLVQPDGWPGQAGAMFHLPYGRVYWFILGLFINIFGDALFAARLVSLLGVLASSLLTYQLALQFNASRQAAVWSAVLVSTCWIALFISHRVRPNSWAAAASMLSLALTASLTTPTHRRWYWYALAGMLVFLPLEFHPTGMYVTLAAAMIAVMHWVGRRQWVSVGLLITGGALTLLFILLSRLGMVTGSVIQLAFADPQGFLAAYVSATGRQLNSPLVPLRWFADFWWRYYIWFAPPFSLIQAVLFIFGIGYAWVKRREQGQYLTLVIVLSSIPFALVNYDFTSPPEYAFMWIPFYVLLAVDAVMSLPPDVPFLARWEKLAPGVILAGLLGVYLAGNLYVLYRERHNPYQQVVQQLTEDIPQGDVVLASSWLWFGTYQDLTLVDETLITTEYTIPWWNAVPDPPQLPPGEAVAPNIKAASIPDAALSQTATNALAQIQPDFIIDDQRVGCAIEATIPSERITSYAESVCRSVKEVDPDITMHFTERYYDTQTLYQCTEN